MNLVRRHLKKSGNFDFEGYNKDRNNKRTSKKKRNKSAKAARRKNR